MHRDEWCTVEGAPKAEHQNYGCGIIDHESFALSPVEEVYYQVMNVSEKTIHDMIRESLKKKVQTPAATTEAEERTGSQKLRDPKKVTEEAMPSFQYREVESITSLPGLPGMAFRVSRSQNPLTSKIQNAYSHELRNQVAEVEHHNLKGIQLTHDIRLDAISLLLTIFEHDVDLSPFERSDIERVIGHLDNVRYRQENREREYQSGLFDPLKPVRR